MRSNIDFIGGERSHGYTKDDDGNVWYWEVDSEGGEVEFREHGYPTGHPIRDGGVPEDVREHAQRHVDSLAGEAR